MSHAEKIQDFIKTAEVQSALGIELGIYTSDKAVREAYEANETRIRLVEKEAKPGLVLVGLFVAGELVACEKAGQYVAPKMWAAQKNQLVAFFNA